MTYYKAVKEEFLGLAKRSFLESKASLKISTEQQNLFHTGCGLCANDQINSYMDNALHVVLAAHLSFGLFCQFFEADTWPSCISAKYHAHTWHYINNRS